MFKWKEQGERYRGVATEIQGCGHRDTRECGHRDTGVTRDTRGCGHEAGLKEIMLMLTLQISYP